MNDKVSSIEISEVEEKSKGGKISTFNLELVKDLEAKVEIRLGTASISVGELFSLQQNSVIKLDQMVDQDLDILLKGEVIAKGQLVAVDDHFGIKITNVAGNNASL